MNEKKGDAEELNLISAYENLCGLIFKALWIPVLRNASVLVKHLDFKAYFRVVSNTVFENAFLGEFPTAFSQHLDSPLILEPISVKKACNKKKSWMWDVFKQKIILGSAAERSFKTSLLCFHLHISERIVLYSPDTSVSSTCLFFLPGYVWIDSKYQTQPSNQSKKGHYHLSSIRIRPVYCIYITCIQSAPTGSPSTLPFLRTVSTKKVDFLFYLLFLHVLDASMVH